MAMSGCDDLTGQQISMMNSNYLVTLACLTPPPGQAVHLYTRNIETLRAYCREVYQNIMLSERDLPFFMYVLNLVS